MRRRRLGMLGMLASGLRGCGGRCGRSGLHGRDGQGFRAVNPAMSLSSAPSALPAWRIRLYAPCVAAAACCAALAGMSATLHEGRLRTAWNVEEAPCRIVARKTGETFALARVPATVGDRPVAAVRVFYSTNELPASVIWADADEGVTILADVTAASRGANLRIYPVPGDALATPAPADARVRDPTPLWGVARRTGGMDFPRSMDDVRMLETRFDRVPRYFAVADFAGLPATATPVAEGGWVQTGWDRPNHLVDLQTWLLVPADASLRFGLVGTTPAWLLLDGEPVLEHPARRAPDAWTASNDLPFKAGLHRVQVRTACRARIDTALAWKRAGEEAVAADVVMVTGSGLLNGRTEWRDHRIHPYAGVEAGKAYRFAGIEGAFVPFTCVNETTLAQAGPLELTWHMGGAAMGEGPTNTVTLRTTGLPAEMKLAVRAGEEAAEHTAQLTFDGPIWAEYDVTSRMTGIPAVCYPDDVVQPIIRVRTTAPDGTAFALEARVDWCAGGATNITAAVATASGWAQVYLCPFEAAAAASLTWELRHAGAAVSSGKTVFAREPFGVLPDAVSGDTLKAGDDTVVLVAANASRGEPVAAARRGREVALLDGFLASEAGLDESSVPAEWNRLDLRALERREGTAGMTWLVPFAEVKGVLPAATIVYAPSVSEAGLHGGVDAFARRVAAMAGLLSGPACGSPRVILVVPPEFDVLPGCGCVAGESPCSHAAAAGAYAEAIIRVADVYALETVNLYNAFKTLRSADTPFVRDGGLTPQGASMALGLIFKKIRR